MVIAYHLVWTLYGWWLPNDPRGSGSHTVGSDVIAQLGKLHHGRKKVQPAGRVVREFYERAASALDYPLLRVERATLPAFGVATESAIRERGYTVWACAIMPDHVHILVRKHRDLGEEMIDWIQMLTRKRLMEMNVRTIDHPTWAQGGWKVYLDSPDDIKRTIRYIDDNPAPIGWSAQKWSFVTPYDNWPFHRAKPHSQ